jgi:hypothetical protein
MALARNCGVAFVAFITFIAVAFVGSAGALGALWGAGCPLPLPLFLLLPKMQPRQTVPLLWGGNPGSGKGIVV